MTIYYNMRELSRSIVFKRIKSLHNQKEKITIDTKKNNYFATIIDSSRSIVIKTNLSGIISKHYNTR